MNIFRLLSLSLTILIILLGNIANAQSSSSTDLKLLSYNVKLMPLPLTGSSGLNGVTYGKRLDGFAEVAAEYDVVGFQEVWRSGLDGHKSELVNRLKKNKFGEFTHFYRGRYNNGLVIASKHEIEDMDEWKFSVSRVEDALVEKGVLYAKIKFNEDEFSHIFLTHLQAQNCTEKGTKKSCVDTRKKQLQELRDHIEGKVNIDEDKIVVMGDFNINQGNKEYKDWMEEWEGLNLSPLDLAYDPTCLKLDYILTRNLSSTKPMKAISWGYHRNPSDSFDEDGPRKISDHPALSTTLNFDSGAFTTSPDFVYSRILQNWNTRYPINVATTSDGIRFVTLVDRHNDMYLAKAKNTNDNWTAIQIKKGWKTHHPINIAVDSKGVFYLTVVGAKAGGIWLLRSTWDKISETFKPWHGTRVMGNNWKTKHPIGIAIDNNDKVYLTVVGDSGNEIWLLKSNNSQNTRWTATRAMGKSWKTKHPIGIAINNNNLAHMTVVGNSANEIWLLNPTSAKNTSWTATQVMGQQNWKTNHEIGITFVNNAIHLSVVGRHKGEVWWLKSTGSGWSPQNIAPVLTTQSSIGIEGGTTPGFTFVDRCGEMTFAEENL